MAAVIQENKYYVKYGSRVVRKISIIIYDPRSNIALVKTNNINQLDMIFTHIQKYDDLDKSLARICNRILDINIFKKSTSLYDEYNLNLIYVININNCNNDMIFHYYAQNKELIWINLEQLYDLYLIDNTKERDKHLESKLQYNLIYTELYAIKNNRILLDFKIARFKQPIFCKHCIYNQKYDEHMNYTNYKWIGAMRSRRELCSHCHTSDKSCRQIIKCDGCHEYIELYVCTHTVYTWCDICKAYNSCVDIEKCKTCSSYYFSSMHHRDKKDLYSFNLCYYCK